MRGAHYNRLKRLKIFSAYTFPRTEKENIVISLFKLKFCKILRTFIYEFHLRVFLMSIVSV